MRQALGSAEQTSPLHKRRVSVGMIGVRTRIVHKEVAQHVLAALATKDEDVLLHHC